MNNPCNEPDERIPSIFSDLLYHVTWWTHDREALLTLPVRRYLHPCLRALARANNCAALEVGGGNDHVHLALRVPPSRSLGDVVSYLKSHSALQVSRSFEGGSHIRWQHGFTASTLTPAALGELERWIRSASPPSPLLRHVRAAS